MEPALRKAVRQRVLRGHVQVQVHFKRTGAARVQPSSTNPCSGPGSKRSATPPNASISNREPDLNQALRFRE